MTSGIITFYILTVTQVLSLIGSRMTSIAFGIWLFQQTGDSAPVLLASFFVMLPQALAGSFGGVIADRWPRRLVLMLTDTGAAVGTALLLLSFMLGTFEVWQLYVVAFLQGALGMMQRPAMDASITMMVPSTHRDRANTLRLMAGPVAGIIAPVLAALIFATFGLVGVISIDLASFFVAVITLWFVRIPEPKKTNPKTGRSHFLDDSKEAFAFLWNARVLFFMMFYAAALNFFLAGSINLATPYILTLTGSEETLGILLGIMNLGMVIGGVIMFVRGGTNPRIHGIMLGLMFRGLALAVYGLVRTPIALAFAVFFVLFSNALVDGSFMSMLQSKVPPHLQGRVFALLFQMMNIATPLSLLMTGYVVDNLLEPAVNTPGWSAVAPLVGSQPGSGMGLFIMVNGVLIFVMTLAVYLIPAVRHNERKMPDYAPSGAII
ncbi:MAG: MFS transporter [Anaerolineaceae bacterium]|nr:MFS transporter [Anaerolineaceae bacterium]